MKHLLVTGLMLASTFAFGDEIRVARQAFPVKVNSVSAESAGTEFPATTVKVSATFGNPCQVPTVDELISITQYTRDFENLVISLGNDSTRACPLHYSPVTVTINLGNFSKPNDGHFSKVIVNGITAK